MSEQPKLLSGGNPQIAKGDGPEVVAAYLEAVPEWKNPLVRQLDALIVDEVPEGQKAVRWNQPFYGMDGVTWCASFHCLTRYIKVAFHNGAALDPMPPEGSKHPKVRYYHVFEKSGFDEAQLRVWVRQASRSDGAPLFRVGAGK